MSFLKWQMIFVYILYVLTFSLVGEYLQTKEKPRMEGGK
jgi:hypothetical protein